MISITVLKGVRALQCSELQDSDMVSTCNCIITSCVNLNFEVLFSDFFLETRLKYDVSDKILFNSYFQNLLNTSTC